MNGVNKVVFCHRFKGDLIRPQNGNSGCQMDDAHAGVATYADDVCLLSPTIFELKCCVQKEASKENSCSSGWDSSMAMKHGPGKQLY